MPRSTRRHPTAFLPAIAAMLLTIPLSAGAALAQGGPTFSSTLGMIRTRVANTIQTEWLQAVGIAKTVHDESVGLFTIDEGGGPDHPAWRTLGPDEQPGGGDGRVVVLVHGLDEPGGLWGDLAPALLERGYTPVRFNYANDQDPGLSACELLDALRDLREAHGVKSVSIVAHSLGGLIARDAFTRPKIDRTELPEITRLITVGTPNHGSALAHFRQVGELREQVSRFVDSSDRDPRELLRFMMDGRGEAGEALIPESEYLAELNARGLPADVPMTVIAGAISPIDSDLIDEAMTYRAVRFVLDDSDADALRDRCDDLAALIGDGVVTLDSQRLEGVDDTVTLPGNHRTLLRRFEAWDAVRSVFGGEPSEPAAIDVILDRLDNDGA